MKCYIWKVSHTKIFRVTSWKSFSLGEGDLDCNMKWTHIKIYITTLSMMDFDRYTWEKKSRRATLDLFNLLALLDKVCLKYRLFLNLWPSQLLQSVQPVQGAGHVTLQPQQSHCYLFIDVFPRSSDRMQLTTTCSISALAQRFRWQWCWKKSRGVNDWFI